MRVRSNSKHSSTSMEVEKPKLKEETHLSGAYIRSLVKQLSSSRPRDLSKPANSAAADDGRSQDERHGELAQKQQQQEASPQASQAPPHKKQVRRRLHTSKPYQERLLNMAEARREIVTALKFHRASMKQAKEQQQQQQQQQQIHNSQVTLLPSPPTSLDQEFPHEVMDPKANSSVRPLNYTFPNYFSGSPLISPLSYSSPFSYNHPSNATAPVLPLSDNFKIPFPNQPLGLNLNLQGFHDIQASFHTKPQLESLPSPSSSSSYSYSSPITATSSMDVGVVPSILTHHDQASRVAMEYPSSMSLHPVMDDAEMAEIHSIGKQHDMEWNDTVNLVTSAWWSKFLKDMEDNKDVKEGGGRGDKLPNSHVFDEVYDMQSCLSDGGGRDGNEGSLFQQQLDSYYHAPEYQHDAALASLDIGELEGWEWLS